MKTAKEAVMTGINQPLEIREYPLTKPAPGMAELELIASGICGTDIHILRGKIPVQTPAAIGHEFVGRVIDISDEDSKAYGIRTGDNAIVDIACPCGKCLLCKNGDDANCLNMGVTNSGNPDKAPYFYGGYGEYNYSPVKNLIKIPNSLNPEMVCVYACAGPTTMHAFRLTEKAGYAVDKTTVAVVQGLGPVGTFAVVYLASHGIKNIVAITGTKKAEREKTALSLGASEVFAMEDTSCEELSKHVRSLSGGIGADLVFEASGNPAAVPVGLELLRNRGVYIIPGQYSNSGTAQIRPQLITFKALHIIGSSQYSVTDVQNYLKFLLLNSQLHNRILSLSSCYALDDVNSAIEDAKSGVNIKTMLIKQNKYIANFD